MELRSDSPTHLARMLSATFAVLERGPLVNLSNVTLPHLASLLRHGTPIPIHGGHGNLFSVHIAEDSELGGRSIAEVFEQFPELLDAPLSAVSRFNFRVALPASRVEINC